eukprot:m.208412 g.208412  ORF g.208412 m.208412 type:complete len:76 (-) comp33005_c0_seq1:783-1010(-)
MWVSGFGSVHVKVLHLTKQQQEQQHDDDDNDVGSIFKCSYGNIVRVDFDFGQRRRQCTTRLRTRSICFGSTSVGM